MASLYKRNLNNGRFESKGDRVDGIDIKVKINKHLSLKLYINYISL